MDNIGPIAEFNDCPDELFCLGREVGISSRADIDEVVRLAGDGSGRRFWRLHSRKGKRYVAIAPELGNVHGMAEAEAVYEIGSHLARCGVPVPRIYGYSADSGILLCEDLGDCHLHRMAIEADWTDQGSIEGIMSLYRQAVEVLAGMQYRGRDGFNPSWCWDTARYDRQLMLERESGYFLRAFWQKMLGQQTPAGLEEEFRVLASFAARAPADYFLHRDFQSRNLMVKDGKIRVIDFQGGRLGPMGYDIASLLLDPYASLPESAQEGIFDWYIASLEQYTKVDRNNFYMWYLGLRLQRNLQIIGAFAFLGIERQKTFFLDFLPPALDTIISQTSKRLPFASPALHDTVCRARELLGAREKSKKQGSIPQG